MKKITDTKTSEILLKGVKLKINPGIFIPVSEITYSTSIILDNLPEIKDKTILDVGCGSGVIAIYCALNGANKVVAVDVNEEAIKNTIENIKLNNASGIEAVKSDIFSNINDSFDYIFANLPISDKDWDLPTSTLNLMKKFIIESKNHINTGGKIYFTWASFSPVMPIKRFLKENKINYHVIREKRLNKVWYLFRIEY